MFISTIYVYNVTNVILIIIIYSVVTKIETDIEPIHIVNVTINKFE